MSRNCLDAYAGTAGVSPATAPIPSSGQRAGQTAFPIIRLSATDAFFVAYQQRSGILMQLGGEVDLEGKLERQHLEQMVSYIVGQWPRLGQCLDKGLFGLKWAGSCRTEQMLRVGNNHNGALAEWRNEPIDPFRDPPFQVLWIPARRVSGAEGASASE